MAVQMRVSTNFHLKEEKVLRAAATTQRGGGVTRVKESRVAMTLVKGLRS